MRTDLPCPSAIDRRLAARLRALRNERGWSLDDLSKRSAVSRATLSRLENGDVSPTATILNRLCSAYGLTMSRLMLLVEGQGMPLQSRAGQELWHDPATGFRRRLVSPPAPGFDGEVIEGEMPAATRIAYAAAPRPGLEHHLVMLEGALVVTLDEVRHELGPGDCLRYRLFGPSRFETGPTIGARYLMFML